MGEAEDYVQSKYQYFEPCPVNQTASLISDTIILPHSHSLYAVHLKMSSSLL